MEPSVTVVFLAYLADALFGEPPARVHPTVWIGRIAHRLEAVSRPFLRSGRALRLTGLILTAGIVISTGAITHITVQAVTAFDGRLGLAAETFFIFTAVARRDLARAGMAIYMPLKEGDLMTARHRLSEIAGRDTDDLPEVEIVRGTVESVAENTVDSIVAPIFFAFLGGHAAAMAYRAANTLDAMWGYRDERYRDFGWAAARLDDLLNLVPARLGALLMVAAARILGQDARRAWHTVRRDARSHPSPNSGYPEAAAAGALRVRLGGMNRYGGVPSPRPYLGDPIHPLSPDRIQAAVALMNLTAHLALVLGVLLVQGMHLLK